MGSESFYIMSEAKKDIWDKLSSLSALVINGIRAELFNNNE